MFDKVVEKIINKTLCATKMCYGHCNFSNPKHHRCGQWHKCYKIAKELYDKFMQIYKTNDKDLDMIIQHLIKKNKQFVREIA